MTTPDQIIAAAMAARKESSAHAAYEVGFFDGAQWMLAQYQEFGKFIKGVPEDYSTYIFMIAFFNCGKQMRQMLIGSISDHDGALLDHDGEPTGWDDASKVITHYMPLPAEPDQP